MKKFLKTLFVASVFASILASTGCKAVGYCQMMEAAEERDVCAPGMATDPRNHMAAHGR